MTVLAIDASNISSGGGLTHLVRLLNAARPDQCGVETIHVWTSTQTARALPDRDWLVVHTPAWCDVGLTRRILAQQLILPAQIRQARCDVLFSPGGTLPFWCDVPMVTMSQNMLPFEPDRAALYGSWSWMRLKMRLLRFSQTRSFLRAKGIVFLTQYAREVVTAKLHHFEGQTALIAHGIEARFITPPRPQDPPKAFAAQRPLRLLYVSLQAPYKHHLELMVAVQQLRDNGWSVELQLVGSNATPYGQQVRRKRLELDPEGAFIKDLGHVEFSRLHDFYRQTDIFVFASSCENLPNILIEAMAAGLPIVCSNRGPMPEVLGDAGIYFDPERPASIAAAITRLADDELLRADLAHRAWHLAQAYSWERCARDTLSFVAGMATSSTGHSTDV